MIGNECGSNPALIAVVLGVLTGTGILYNWFVAWLQRKGYDEGYTALLVAVGVMFTLAGASCLVGIQAIIIITWCFVASGTPMILGDVWRYVRSREDVAKLINNAKGAITNDPKTTAGKRGAGDGEPGGRKHQ